MPSLHELFDAAHTEEGARDLLSQADTGMTLLRDVMKEKKTSANAPYSEKNLSSALLELFKHKGVDKRQRAYKQKSAPVESDKPLFAKLLPVPWGGEASVSVLESLLRTCSSRLGEARKKSLVERIESLQKIRDQDNVLEEASKLITDAIEHGRPKDALRSANDNMRRALRFLFNQNLNIDIGTERRFHPAAEDIDLIQQNTSHLPGYPYLLTAYCDWLQKTHQTTLTQLLTQNDGEVRANEYAEPFQSEMLRHARTGKATKIQRLGVADIGKAATQINNVLSTLLNLRRLRQILEQKEKESAEAEQRTPNRIEFVRPGGPNLATLSGIITAADGDDGCVVLAGSQRNPQSALRVAHVTRQQLGMPAAQTMEGQKVVYGNKGLLWQRSSPGPSQGAALGVGGR